MGLRAKKGKRTGTELTETVIKEVSGVDFPAHEAPGWIIYKSVDAPELTDDEVDAALADLDYDDEDDLDEGDDVADAALTQRLEAVEAELAVEKAKRLAVEKAIGAAGGADKADPATVTKAVAAAEADAADAVAFEKAVAGMTPEARSYFEKQRAETAEARRIAQDEQNRRVEQEYLAVAKSRDYAGVATGAEQLATLLRTIDSRLPADQAAEVKRVIKSAAASDQFATLGGHGQMAGPDSPEAKVEAKVAEIRKADPNMSRAQAFVKARELDPELLAAYTAEMQKGA